MIPGRPDDAFGAAISYSRISNYVRGFDVNSGLPIARTSETTLELTYQYQIVSGWNVQPDFQYVVNPRQPRGRARGARVKDDGGVRRAHHHQFLM